tara:strand:+ start:397 stop:618 length:222 start_codon:yes stop_codon:yes gene_type:complete
METTAPVLVEFIVNSEASEQIKDLGLKWVKPYGKHISVKDEIDETLVESLSNDDLIEYIGIDSQFLIYLNIKG